MIDPMVMQQVMERDGFKCVYCGYGGTASFDDWERARLCIDHFVPRAKGGTDAIENLFTACAVCNSGKGSNVFPSLDHARQWLKLYREECSQAYFDTFVTRTAKTWKPGGIERTWKRYNAQLETVKSKNPQKDLC
jgi:5-methylcytosine-specific restriction endonuclease McrA